MTIKTDVFTLSSTATQIATGLRAKVNDAASVLVHDPTADVYLGGSDVTTADGVLVPAGESLSIDLGPGDMLYAIVASGTPTVKVMTTRTGFVAP